MSVYEDIKTGLEQAIAYEKENNIKKEKAILIIDMPSCCSECFALDDNGDDLMCLITQEQKDYTFRTREQKMDKCPLKPMPEKYDIEAERNKPHDRDYDWEFEGGYNACLDEILGI